MPEPIHQTDGQPEHPSVRSEPRDARFSWILGIVVAAALLGALIFYMVWVFFSLERKRLDVARQSRFPLAPKPSHALPPEPRLEPLDRASGITESNVYLRQEEKLKRLDRYGTTEDKGYIHIPIDQAMRLLADQLPARTETVGEAGVGATATVGLAAGPGGPLLAATGLFPGRSRAIQSAWHWRQNGLVTGGESNSGRMFNRGDTRWSGR